MDYTDNFDMHDTNTGSATGGLETSFNDHGDFVIKTPNQMQGHDTFVNGQHTTHTETNGIGWQNVYHGHELSQVAVPHDIGTTDLFDGNMHYQGTMMPDGLGGEDYLSMTGNSETIMNYSDPLAHVNDLHFPAYDVNER